MGIVQHAKELADLIKKYNDQDLYQRIVELREEILQLREENLSLKEQVTILEVNSQIANDLVRDGNCYYRKADEKRSHPLCMTCWDYDQKAVNLILGSDPNYGHTTIRCAICSARGK